MAQNSEFFPLAVPMPSESTAYNTYKSSWYGLWRADEGYEGDFADRINTGYLRECRNIDPSASPLLRPAPKWEKIFQTADLTLEPTLVAFAGIRNIPMILRFDNNSHPAGRDYILVLSGVNNGASFSFNITNHDNGFSTSQRRTILQFNKFEPSSTSAQGTYTPYILIFPDCISIRISDLEAALGGSNLIYECFRRQGGTSTTQRVSVPDLDYAVAHQGRIVGVSGSMVYVSAFNSFTDWDVDTADDIDIQNAWYSQTQANVKATDNFVGMADYQNSVVLFKPTYTQRVTGNGNPYRIVDVVADGAIDGRSICDVGGTLLYVSGQDVMAYTGGNPTHVGTLLGIKHYREGVAGAYRDMYYLSQENRIFTYSTRTGLWGSMDEPIIPEQSGKTKISQSVIGFIPCDSEFYCVVSSTFAVGMTPEHNYAIFKLSAEKADNWYAVTCLSSKVSSGLNLDPKRMKSAQLAINTKSGAKVAAYLVFDKEEFDPENPGLKLFSSKTGWVGDTVLRTYIRKSSGTGYSIVIVGEKDATVNDMALQISYERGHAQNERV